MKKQFLVLPLIIFAMVAVFAYRGLSIDGTSMPSALIGEPAPSVQLETIPRHRGPFNPSDLKGQVSLVNIWGSWCVNCLYEHPLFLDLQQQGVLIYGLAWNDDPEASAKWLDRHGNPFEQVGADPSGRLGAEFGVTGAPETFVIDKAGKIRYRHVGPISEQSWRRRIKPLMDQLEAETIGPAA